MSNWFRALWILPVLALAACGGGGGGGGGGSPLQPNRAPTANFAYVCEDLLCRFTSTSTDQDAGDAIVTYSWNFGDASTLDTRANPSHTFATLVPKDFDVSLTVGDRSGATTTVVRKITVNAPAAPAAPHAAFTSSCTSLDCTFTDNSSYDVGSVRLTERHVRTDPPSVDERAAVVRAASDAFQSVPDSVRGAPVVGIAGTVTTLAAVSLGMETYDGSRVHGLTMPVPELERVIDLLARVPLEERRTIAGLEPKRADVIIAGGLVALAFVRHIGASEITVSDRGVRWGLAEELAG